MFASLLQLGVEALKERYLRHVKAPARPQGERTMQLNIIRKDSAPSGQEELHAESVTVTIKEGAEEPVATKPGLDTRVMCTFERFCLLSDLTNSPLSFFSQERSC